MDPDIQESVDQQTLEATTEPEGTQSEAVTPNINPAWDFLEKIPEEFHQHITPKLSEWDKNFQEVQQKQAPYKEFIELGVPADDIQQSLQLRHLWNTNPKGLYEYLADQLQISQGQEKEESKEKEDEYDISQIPDLEKDPRFKAMQEKVGQFDQLLEAQRLEEARQTAASEIDQQFQQAETKYGKLDSNLRERIAKIAIANRDQDLVKAAEEYFTQWAPVKRASDSAPSVLGGNSGLPKQTALKDLANMDGDQRSKKLAEFIAGMANNE